jgi:hypothetical protein
MILLDFIHPGLRHPEVNVQKDVKKPRGLEFGNSENDLQMGSCAD